MALSADRTAASKPAIAPPEMAGAEGRSAEVLARILSAIGLAALLSGCLYLGWPFFHLLILAAAGLMAREWARLCGRGRTGSGGFALIVVCVIVVALASFAMTSEASLVLILGAPAVGLAARTERPSDAVWLGAGVLYVGGAAWATVALFDLFRDGMWAVAWIFAVVALTDIGAFLVGRMAGGPQLAPRLSPKKTWSGFFGGLACAALAGLAFALVADRQAAGFHIACGAGRQSGGASGGFVRIAVQTPVRGQGFRASDPRARRLAGSGRRRGSGHDPGCRSGLVARRRGNAMALEAQRPAGPGAGPRRSESARTDGPRRITILGATGSIGKSTLDLVARQPDGFAVEALTAQP